MGTTEYTKYAKGRERWTTFTLLLRQYCVFARPEGTRSLTPLLLRSGAVPSS